MTSAHAPNMPLRHRRSMRQLPRTSHMEALPLIPAIKEISFGLNETPVVAHAHMERQVAPAKLEDANPYLDIQDDGYVSPNLVRRVLGTKLSTIKEQLSLATLKSDTGRKRKLRIFPSRKRHTVSGVSIAQLSNICSDADGQKLSSMVDSPAKGQDTCWPSHTIAWGAPNLLGASDGVPTSEHLSSHYTVFEPNQNKPISPKSTKESAATEGGFMKLFQGFLLRQLEGPHDGTVHEIPLEHFSSGVRAATSGSKAQLAMRHASGNAVPVSPARLAASSSVRSATLPKSLMRRISLRSARFSWSEDTDRHNVDTETIRTGEMINSFPIPPLHAMPRIPLVSSGKKNRKSMWSAFPKPFDEALERPSNWLERSTNPYPEILDANNLATTSQCGDYAVPSNRGASQILLGEHAVPINRLQSEGRHFIRSASRRSVNSSVPPIIERRPCSRQLARARSDATHITSLIQVLPDTQSVSTGMLDGGPTTDELSPDNLGD